MSLCNRWRLAFRTPQSAFRYFLMRFINVIKVALRALRRSAMRSVLTALGIIIGVAAVIAMVSIGNGAKSQVEASIASLGQNLINIFPGNFTAGAVRGGWGSASSLTVEDAEAIQREVSGVAAITPEMRDRTQVLANGLNWNTQVLGEDVAYLDIRLWSIADGEMFSEVDVRSGNKVCVIGATVAAQLFPESDPIDQNIRIRNIPFKVVGVLAPWRPSPLGGQLLRLGAHAALARAGPTGAARRRRRGAGLPERRA